MKIELNEEHFSKTVQAFIEDLQEMYGKCELPASWYAEFLTVEVDMKTVKLVTGGVWDCGYIEPNYCEGYLVDWPAKGIKGCEAHLSELGIAYIDKVLVEKCEADEKDKLDVTGDIKLEEMRDRV